MRLYIFSILVRTFLLLLLIVGIIFSSIYVPELHKNWLRQEVGSRVYLIKDSLNSGGGTGFAIKAPSGINYIITNDHVCDLSKDTKTVLVLNDFGLSMRRKILKKSIYSDLCLIEGLPNVEGLSLGKEPKIGDTVVYVGHPSLLPITTSRGEIISIKNVFALNGIIARWSIDTEKWEPGEIALADCLLPKNKNLETNMPISNVNTYVRICITVIKGAYRTNMFVRTGASGSPVVDFLGNIIGVVFAEDKVGWGSLVSHKDLVNFLKDY